MARPTKTGSAVLQRGFTYLGLMLIVASMGAALAATAQVWSTVVQREKERELLFIGEEFRKALKAFAAGARNTTERTPRTLNDLIKDPRHPDTRRYLRKLYIDPMTGKPEWGLQKDTKGGIVGVFSLSEAKPWKVAEFTSRDRDFEGKTKYSQWIFLPKADGSSTFRDALGRGQAGSGEVPESDVRRAIDADVLNQFLQGGSSTQGAGSAK
jgi:type II secretory pathway pseudopilin PulG